MPLQFPVSDTLPHLLLTLIAISGELPASLISRLPGSSSYLESIVTQLKKDRLVRTFYRNGLRGLRLTSEAKKTLLVECPERFRLYFSGNTDTNRLKSEVPRRLRLHRMAEVLVTMYNADVGLFADEKPPVFSPVLSDDLRIEWPAYYNSREVKEMGACTTRVRNSRSTGVLLTMDSIYIIYNVGSSHVKWDHELEKRLIALLRLELCQHRMPEQYSDSNIFGLVFGEGMDPAMPLLTDTAGRGHNFLVSNLDFPHFHYLTNDSRGELLLQLLCHAEKRAALDAILSENLRESNPRHFVVNDGFDARGDPVLFGYTCDTARITGFNTKLSLRGRRGTLICFDFQEEVLRSVCGPQIEIQSLDFEKVRALFSE